MSKAKKSNLLLTGPSTVGKSTLIRKISESLHNRNIRGIISESIMTEGMKGGWMLGSLHGGCEKYIHKDIQSEHKLGGLGVDLGLLERLTESELKADADIYLIDEIGRTGAWSPVFMKAVKALLDSQRIVIAAIHMSLEAEVGEIRRRQDAELWEVTRDNRDGLLERALSWIDRRGE